MKQQNTRPDNYNSLFAVNFRNLIDKAKDGYQKLGRKKNIRKELADHCGVSEQSISNWYNGKNEPDPMQRKAIAEYFGIAEDFLFGDHSLRRSIRIASEEKTSFDVKQIWTAIFKSAFDGGQDYFSRAISLFFAYSEFVPEMLKCITRAAQLLEDKTTPIKLEDLTIDKEFAVRMLIRAYCEQLEKALIKATYDQKITVSFSGKGDAEIISKWLEGCMSDYQALETKINVVEEGRFSLDDFIPILFDLNTLQDKGE